MAGLRGAAEFRSDKLDDRLGVNDQGRLSQDGLRQHGQNDLNRLSGIQVAVWSF